LKKAAAEMGLTSPYAVASLLGVAGGESHWEIVEEKFGYSADRLLQVFPSVFKGDRELAQKYAGNPNNSLPEFLYGYDTAKGKGLGNTEPGDGAKFIGRGYIGLTGRANYTNFSKWMYEARKLPTPTALVDNPKMINDPKIAAEVSVLYFLKLVKTAQTDPGYFEAAYRRVGFCTQDIYTRKKGYYECFLAQLKGTTVSSGSGGIVTDGSGNPIKTGSAN
jgi:predicted chitinase